MGNADWCAWCNCTLKGKNSWRWGLCYKCRNSDEGKEYIEKIEREDHEEMIKNYKPNKIMNKVYKECRK